MKEQLDQIISLMVQQHNASLLPQKHGELEIGTRPTPSPQRTQALVKVTAAAANPADWKIIDSGLFFERFPAVLGLDGAGVIHIVGSEVTKFKVGDRVIFQGTFNPDHGCYQEYALVDTGLISKIPNNINDDQASTIPSAAIAAYFGLFQNTCIDAPLNAQTASGKPLLVLGGSSSVGQFGKHSFPSSNSFALLIRCDAAIQFARIAGFSPIVTTASSHHASLLKSLGATHVFDRDTDAETVQSAFTVPVSLVFDAISSDVTQPFAFDVLSIPSLVPGARLILLQAQTDSLKKKNAAHSVIINQVYGSSEVFQDIGVSFWQKIGQWIEEGELVSNRVQLVNGGLTSVPEALRLSRKGVSGVKLVIRPQE
ncbi:Zinc-type alcohol dehydrogenase-like protein C2E1P3,01 OS=Schizosaccharomyces pombe (strain 972 / ATCC 24843) GN=SPAC2E1P3.01 PE=3 SV=1 [Rhizoctonia solani AG-1 IB]|uniref:Zinc-type alcohol dehydrogenase-like protein C2E1P3,01 n=1 Tax=Thanatephorus cucumeris (strain AG1-IB / isolate 7/3/14) TaxID=1108050 RepID=A0A0B7FK47_THACB|nr:Zinc-type alcohol dehydrogenase-like protein C2E1P3,01 OS=Schizosaccharomyces pombe (strain 972 / ATCC 24843) GN=SPAC2E1P3.01 PE=3 SV=1 [Rhizoctonia solani AG-1 IB]